MRFALPLFAATLPVALALAFPGQAGWLLGAGLVALLLCGLGLFGVERVLLAFHRPRPAGGDFHPELPELAHLLAARAGVTPPRLFVIDSPIPNAMAGGSAQRGTLIAVTTGLLGLLDREELCAVLGHEMAHLRMGSGQGELVSGALRGGVKLAGVLAHRALLLSLGRPEDRCRNWLAGLFAGAALTLAQLARTRSQEFQADAEGALLCGDPRWLARALRKLEPFESRCAASRCGPHPPLAERIQRLEATLYGAYL